MLIKLRQFFWVGIKQFKLNRITSLAARSCSCFDADI